ncbi:site-2 protease family protein [Georgenia sp. TF02-10]|uniref:M50 family metallopeptidase n=1 Tax=Georgenia sp. TF02-10 TaxID=2917725 RepID=UPI001FA778E1|nr:site-2 protease family protein [Georgenia sp. TF02-10]UNX55912.1 site-2 protease family protein [Georgenia sp. TF02-10]
MEFVVGVLILLVGLVVSIALHEIGHLVPAKRFGVLVPQYMVGFGKTLWSRTVRGTEYGIKALPLGGYVRMVGMYPPARRAERTRPDGRPTLVQEARAAALEEVPPGQEHRTFYRLSVPRKLVVMLGGPTMNLLISAVLLAVIATGLGVGQNTTTLGAVQECLPAQTTAADADDAGTAAGTAECTPADPAAPGAAAGLRPGDQVLAWGGTPVDSWADISAAIAAGPAAPTEVTVERDGQRLTLTVTPALAERPVLGDDGQPVRGEDGEVRTEQRPFVGIGPTFALVRQPLSAVPGLVWDTFTGTVEVLLTLPQRLVDIAQAAFGAEERDPSVVGLVGVGRFAGEIASVEGEGYGLAERSADMLSLLVSLNMALFVFNLIPLLPLDGGHVAGALWEGGRRAVARVRDRSDPGPVDTARMLPVTYAVVAVMLGMSVLLAYADIVRPVTLG